MNYLTKIALAIGLSAVATGCIEKKVAYNLPEANGKDVIITLESSCYPVIIGDRDKEMGVFGTDTLRYHACPEGARDITLTSARDKDLVKLVSEDKFDAITKAVLNSAEKYQ